MCPVPTSPESVTAAFADVCATAEVFGSLASSWRCGCRTPALAGTRSSVPGQACYGTGTAICAAAHSCLDGFEESPKVNIKFPDTKQSRARVWREGLEWEADSKCRLGTDVRNTAASET